MDINGKFRLNESSNLINKSSIVVNHEQIRLNKTIDNLKILLLQKDNELVNINEDKISLDRQLLILGSNYTELQDEINILNNRNTRETSLANRYKLDLDKIQANLDKCKELNKKKKEEIKQLKSDKKALFDEKADILITKKELTDSKKVILRSSVTERMKVKKQVILPSVLKNFQKEINKILNEFKIYYNNWLKNFVNNWKGDNSNILSLSSNRSIEILKKFGYNQNFQKNGIPFKKIIQPSDGWILYDIKSIDYLVKDYSCFHNILPKSCPGCDDFVLDKNIDLPLKTLFDAVNTSIPGNSFNNFDNQELIIDSSYNNYKYWSNCKEIIDKCVVCSNNIVDLNDKLKNINKLNSCLSTLFDNINDILEEYLLIEDDYDKMKILLKELLKEVSKIYDLISNQFFEIKNYDYNRDNIFVQVDCVSKIDKLNVIQWIRQVPLVYGDPIFGPNVFQIPEYNPIEYLIANKNGDLSNHDDDKTYQLAGDLGNEFFITTDKQDNKVHINDRWEIIKTSEEFQDDIINFQEESNINNIILYFKNIIDFNTKLDSLFTCELDNLNL